MTGHARIDLDRDSCRAGEHVTGTCCGTPAGARVALERHEAQPGGIRRFVIAEAVAAPVDGRFMLAVPAAVLPSVEGDRCALHYAVVTSDAPGAAVIVHCSGRPHVDTGSRLAGRLLRSWEARHFHIELDTAELYGGGSLSGRVHRHGPWPAGFVAASARCLECWRFAVLGPHPPQWDERLLWQAYRPLALDPDAHWAPFSFRLPDRLPAAVEGRTIAWRYEVLVSRTAHWLPAETAALTPLLHEEPA
jgi:hypothetical protein